MRVAEGHGRDNSQPPRMVQPPPNYTNFHNMGEREQFLRAAFAADGLWPLHIVVHDCGTADIYAYVERPRADHNATDAEHRRCYSIPEIEELFGVLLAQIQTTGQDMPVPPYPGRRDPDLCGEDEDGQGQSSLSA